GLVDVERKVAAALEEEAGRRHGRPQAEARAHTGQLPDRGQVLAADQLRDVTPQVGVDALGRNALRKAVDRAGLAEVLREKRAVEVAPRLEGLQRLERNAGDDGVPRRAASERDPPGADLRVADLRPRREPLELGADVCNLARAVEGDVAAGGPVSAGVRGEDRVPLGEVGGPEARDEPFVAAAESVEH